MVIKARPHHICCIPFFIVTFPERGKKFNKADENLRTTLSVPGNIKIKAIEGTDDLCAHCTLCVDGKCASPKGNEQQVRKWDSILLDELDVGYGTELPASGWEKLIAQKVPFRIFPKCQWKKECKVGLSVE